MFSFEVLQRAGSGKYALPSTPIIFPTQLDRTMHDGHVELVAAFNL